MRIHSVSQGAGFRILNKHLLFFHFIFSDGLKDLDFCMIEICVGSVCSISELPRFNMNHYGHEN